MILFSVCSQDRATQILMQMRVTVSGARHRQRGHTYGSNVSICAANQKKIIKI